ncbi:MAG TPA: transcriptional repressor [Phototrophicaceae bacterium]|nr:transcriptional repressor [Phototrophicaceae bacterium]
MTRQRAAVSALLERTEDFRSAQQLHESLRESGDTIGLATVYRTLQGLVETGEVDVLRADDGETLYRRCESDKHHHHLVCRR